MRESQTTGMTKRDRTIEIGKPPITDMGNGCSVCKFVNVLAAPSRYLTVQPLDRNGDDHTVDRSDRRSTVLALNRRDLAAATETPAASAISLTELSCDC